MTKAPIAISAAIPIIRAFSLCQRGGLDWDGVAAELAAGFRLKPLSRTACSISGAVEG
ncbi:Uncharacterised protein [Vibrio cholerae]|nr:Uncharacterised protein [Vibrio cholerae]CSC34498.1 Uncharacterised protein [Vibrio cholerae]CSI49207.1 Uncharacterised protein [Vibrio cholerae]